MQHFTTTNPVTHLGVVSTYENNSRDIITVAVKWIIFTGVCQTITLCGIGTNIINIVCFVKQGFRDPVNVSLLGLAFSDLGSLTTVVWSIICFNPSFGNLDLPFEPIEFQYHIGGIPHFTFTSISAWITAFVTLERCLCITSPLKVKQIVTSRRVGVVIVCTFVVIISGVSPLYIVNRIGLKFFPARNKTLLGLVTIPNGELIQGVTYIINITFLPLCAFLIIIVCTITLVIKLKLKTKWRKESTSTSETVSNRNQKVANMVIMISSLFIACFVPNCFVFLCFAVIPDFSITGKYRDLAVMVGGIGLALETVNSSANIFIYYHMSSKYKSTFRERFCAF